MSPIISPRTREGSRRPALRALHSGAPAETLRSRPDESVQRRPALRIVPGGGRRSAPHSAPVLLAGASERIRATLRAELGATLPSRTRWVEADDVAGALEHAAHSRMVILAGDLDDADTESLLRLLGRRHPELPVICVDAPLPAVAGGCA
ncbi:MAG TPA: hypothetical protein VGH60_02300 [Solirubrobacteraceae bacterium]